MASRWSAPELKNPSKKGDPSGAGRFAPLQAHPSMRKCSDSGIPVEGFLDDLPILRHPEKSEEIRHANAGTGQFSRPVCDFDPNHSDRFEDVDADDTRFDARCWSISINPIEQKFRSNGELIAGITKKRGLRVE